MASVQDQAARDEIEALKRQFDGYLSPDATINGMSPEEWKPEP